MKILYFGMSSNLGGIESFIMNYYQYIDKKKYHINFVKHEKRIHYEEELKKEGSKIFYFPGRNQNPFVYYICLVKFFKMHRKYDILHMHLNTCSCIAPAVIAKFFGIKVIAHSHSKWEGRSKITWLFHSINKHILRLLSDKNLACSKKAGKWMFGRKSFAVLPNAIDLKKYLFNAEKREQIRNQLQIKEEFIIGHVGRFDYAKNHTFLIDVFCKLHQKEKNTKLLLVGEGNLKEELKEKVMQLRIEDSVIFTGLRKDVPELLMAMDVFVFPSLFEGLGTVCVEAQASGLPCIISDAIPNKAVLCPLVEKLENNGDLSSWIASLEKIINCEKQLNRCQYYNKIASSDFNIINSIRQLEVIYDSVKVGKVWDINDR